MFIFKGIPPGKSESFDNRASVMCPDCLKVVKALMARGSFEFEVCEKCREALKSKFFAGKYPDRN